MPRRLARKALAPPATRYGAFINLPRLPRPPDLGPTRYLAYPLSFLESGHCQVRDVSHANATIHQELGSMYDYLAKIILLGPSGSGK